MATLNRILVWYRNDLRLHDHIPLSNAAKQGATVIPVYCFDPRSFRETAFGLQKTGAFRAQFLLESVADLRSRLQSIGSDLIVRQGQPEDIIPALVEQYQITAIHYHTEVTAEEKLVETNLRSRLKVPCRATWGHTLYSPDELPFSIKELPELFTAFRKQVEAETGVEPSIAAPKQLQPLPNDLDRGELPTLADWGLTPIVPSDLGVLPFKGGETAGMARLQDYFWEQNCLRDYKETRNGMLGANYSSKFSPWLALGCLSPRYIYDQVQMYEEQRIRNDSTYWLIFELLWREYFRLICAKHGNAVFKIEGLRGVRIAWKRDPVRFSQWCEGQTGFPLVDANMRELAATGFMSNRGRQNVASFLTKNLGIDWRLGAAYFESMLLDYDPCSNWGNWNYTAGVGNDARGFRFFNITKQAKDYDRAGEYVKHWCPELATIPAGRVHEPWSLSPTEQKQWNVRLGVDYPQPVVDLFKSAATNEAIYNAAFGDSSPSPKPKPKKRR
jgi:deoxyribodipyrimidine photo-lyase